MIQSVPKETILQELKRVWQPMPRTYRRRAVSALPSTSLLTRWMDYYEYAPQTLTNSSSYRTHVKAHTQRDRVIISFQHCCTMHKVHSLKA